MKNILLLFVFLMVQISTEGYAIVPAPPQKVQVQGHRGARARRPENTLPGFLYAMQVGANVIELDLAVTQDKKLVVSHDPHINREICVDKDGKDIASPVLIHGLTLSQVQEYDCGRKQNPKFPKQVTIPNTRIPTLEQVFQLVISRQQFKNILINIEIKMDPSHPDYTVSPEEFADLVIKEIKKFNFMDRVILQSFDPRPLEVIQKIAPTIPISLLIQDPNIDLVKAAQKYKVQFMAPHYLLVNAAKVQALHNLNVKVAVWTANETTDWKNAVDRKVDSIITDDPEALIEYLKDQKR